MNKTNQNPTPKSPQDRLEEIAKKGTALLDDFYKKHGEYTGTKKKKKYKSPKGINGFHDPGSRKWSKNKKKEDVDKDDAEVVVDKEEVDFDDLGED